MANKRKEARRGRALARLLRIADRNPRETEEIHTLHRKVPNLDPIDAPLANHHENMVSTLENRYGPSGGSSQRGETKRDRLKRLAEEV